MFGPSWWTLLTCLGHACDELRRLGRARPALATRVGQTVELISHVIPCIHCRRSFKVFLERLKAEERATLPELLGTGRALYAVWRLHCMVDEKLHRQHLDAALERVGGVPIDVAARLEAAGLYEPRRPTLEVVRKRISIGTMGRVNETHMFTILFSLALDHPQSRAEEVEDPEAPLGPGAVGRTISVIEFLGGLESVFEGVVAPALGCGPRLEDLCKSIRSVRSALVRAPSAGGLPHAPRAAFVEAVAREYLRVFGSREGVGAVVDRFTKALAVSSCSHGTCE